MGTITKMVQQHMVRFRHEEMKFNELTQPGWKDAADYICELYKKNGTSEMTIPVVVRLQTDDDAPAPPPTTFGGLMECIDIVPRISQMPQWTSRPGSSHIRLRSVKPHSQSSIPSGVPSAELDSSMLLKAKRVEAVRFHPCKQPAADYHIDIKFRRRDADGSCVCARIDMHTVI